METQIISHNIWQQDGESYFPSSSFSTVKALPPAIYKYNQTMTGWFLSKTAPHYTFPYKIYGVNDQIVNRVKSAWKGLPSNFGVLLNGLKGTGKTITAQQIVNWAINENIMVLNVPSPIPLAAVMEKVNQDMLILFDEFEKTHNEQDNPGAQQQLLSAIDGLSKNDYRRMFLFTTNSKKVNENLVDRPSRIRYCWEFTRVSSDLVDMLLNDMLDKSLSHLRSDIVKYLNGRDVLTIDVVKTVITECNIFRESPDDFKSFMNLTEKEPGAFKIELVNEFGLGTEISSYFKSDSGAWLLSIMTKSGIEDFIKKYCASGKTATIHSSLGQTIQIVGPTDKHNEWICTVQLPVYKTWIGPKLQAMAYERHLWLDDKPKDWKYPEWAKKIEKGESLSDDEDTLLNDWLDSYSVYGQPTHAKVRVRFTVDENPFVYNHNSINWLG